MAEIVGGDLPYLWLREGGSPLLVIPAAWLALLVWLLRLHPTASGRVWVAYGGIDVTAALLRLQLVDGVPLTRHDLVGSALALRAGSADGQLALQGCSQHSVFRFPWTLGFLSTD